MSSSPVDATVVSARRCQILDRAKHLPRPDRLRDVAVHACRQTAFTIAFEGVSRHSKDRHMTTAVFLVRADDAVVSSPPISGICTSIRISSNASFSSRRKRFTSVRNNDDTMSPFASASAQPVSGSPRYPLPTRCAADGCSFAETSIELTRQSTRRHGRPAKRDHDHIEQIRLFHRLRC